MKLKELIQNADGKLSGTGVVQITGHIVLSLTLLLSAFKGSTDLPELFMYYALFCGSQPATKGAVKAYRYKLGEREEAIE